MRPERLRAPAPATAGCARAPRRLIEDNRRRSAARWVHTGIVLLAMALTEPSVTAQAGWHSLGRWAQSQGMPQDTVFALHQSRDGYLWLGTRAGVARFDGAAFTTFDNRDPTQLRDNEVWALTETADGALWIGTYGGGLSRIRNGQFTVLSTRDGLVNDFVSAVCEDADGTLWIATDGGVSAWRDGRFTNFTTADGLGNKTVWSLCRAKGGGLWAGTKSGVVNRIKDGAITTCDLGPVRLTSEIRAILEDHTGTLWIGTTMQGLVRVRDGVVTQFSNPGALPSNRVTALHEGADGNLWIGTAAGLVRHQDGRFWPQRLDSKAGRAETIMALTTDKEGSLWVGTGDAGVVCLRRSLFTSYTTDDGLPDEFISGIVQDGRGQMLVATRKGVGRLHDGRVVPYGIRNGLPELSNWGLTRDRTGTLWLATEHGLYGCPPEARTPEGEHLFTRYGGREDSLRDISARVVLRDRDGALWIGTTIDGLIRSDAHGETVFTTRNGLPSNSIRGLCEGPDGALWIGTRGGGLTCRRDGRFTVFTEKDGLISDLVQTLFMDSEGTLWIGTRQGLGSFRDGTFARYTVADGLFVNYLSGIGEDRQGNLWMSSAKGVFRASKEQLAAFAAGRIRSITCVAYGTEHGVSSTVGSVGVHPTVYTSDDGRVWFGTVNGVNVVDPTSLKPNQLPPPVHLTRVNVDGRNFDPEATVAAPPGRGDLEFRYSGVSFIAPEKMRFKYQLDGYDPDWIDAGARREAFYGNIPPGTYRFRVIAANSDGVWNGTGADVNVTIEPHVFQTRWFRGVIALATVGLVLGGIRWRVHRLRVRADELRLQNEELERRIAERTAELSQSYEDLRASEYFYQSLVESLPQIIMRKDTSGRITYANEAYGEFIGRPLIDIVGHLESEFHPPQLAAKIRDDDARMLATRQPMEFQTTVERRGETRYLQVKKLPLHNDRGEPIGVQVLYWDLTAFRATEEKLRQAQRELIEISRLAGIAEVATGVLHNLGNALNSVNISAAVAAEQIRKLKLQNLHQVAALLNEQGDRVDDFLTHDPRGRRIPEYLRLLGDELETHRDTALHEMDALRASIEHIKEIVAAQEANARVTGVTEVITAGELLEYALRINEGALSREGIVLSREFAAPVQVSVQRGKALQILGNLIQNAKDSLVARGGAEKQLVVGFRTLANGGVALYVSDNGVGIAPENLTRIFEFGFTTKAHGHGFGLHSSALAAAEIGGKLTVESKGPGHGATFTLVLPVAPAAA